MIRIKHSGDGEINWLKTYNTIVSFLLPNRFCGVVDRPHQILARRIRLLVQKIRLGLRPGMLTEILIVWGLPSGDELLGQGLVIWIEWEGSNLLLLILARGEWLFLCRRIGLHFLNSFKKNGIVLKIMFHLLWLLLYSILGLTFHGSAKRPCFLFDSCVGSQGGRGTWLLCHLTTV